MKLTSQKLLAMHLIAETLYHTDAVALLFCNCCMCTAKQIVAVPNYFSTVA